jgi:hypothetical protein
MRLRNINEAQKVVAYWLPIASAALPADGKLTTNVQSAPVPTEPGSRPLKCPVSLVGLGLIKEFAANLPELISAPVACDISDQIGLGTEHIAAGGLRGNPKSC